ncbi:uncharacterized protein LOC131303924 [Rhododendron vialii]|uniref:uncharacterized protein LOC131303924 n=1 Tax=Rhododendron vialii TaxID=182163 RepID=UPI00265E6505|nr:uncharacterized protein LOC131303924 [Rhododendron vialii]
MHTFVCISVLQIFNSTIFVLFDLSYCLVLPSTMVVDETSSICNLGILDSLNGDVVREIMESWNDNCLATEALLNGRGDPSFGSKLVSQARNLFKYGLESLVEGHFAGFLEETFEKNGASKFWEHFDAYNNAAAQEMIMDPVCTFENFTMVCWVTIICLPSLFYCQKKCVMDKDLRWLLYLGKDYNTHHLFGCVSYAPPKML